jgi:hypothetical protein
MVIWDFYIEESYNDDHTLCIGGFLAPAKPGKSRPTVALPAALER